MGFPVVEIRMPVFEGANAKLDQWLCPLGVYVDSEEPIARIMVDGMVSQLFCNMPVVLNEIKAAAGSSLASNTLLAFASAEGHEIPYDRPNARLEKAA